MEAQKLAERLSIPTVCAVYPGLGITDNAHFLCSSAECLQQNLRSWDTSSLLSLLPATLSACLCRPVWWAVEEVALSCLAASTCYAFLLLVLFNFRSSSARGRSSPVSVSRYMAVLKSRRSNLTCAQTAACSLRHVADAIRRTASSWQVSHTACDAYSGMRQGQGDLRASAHSMHICLVFQREPVAAVNAD